MSTDQTNPLATSSHTELCEEVLRLRGECARLREQCATLERDVRDARARETSSQRDTARLATRERMPDERIAYTQVFRLGYTHSDGHPDVMQLYFTVGEYDDGRLGEVLIKADKAGTLGRGLLDSIGIVLSLAIQYGVPLEVLLSKLKGTKFAPDGIVAHPVIRFCTSPVDLLAKYLELKYLQPKETP